MNQESTIIFQSMDFTIEIDTDLIWFVSLELNWKIIYSFGYGRIYFIFKNY